jgi:RNA polymerase sigma-70 factor (ECF subfamily)
LISLNFETLVEKYSRSVLNTALRILGDSHKAQDVHQEVFLAIWKRWQTFNGQTNWNGYLYRTTVRKAIELAKKKPTIWLDEKALNCQSSDVNPEQLARAAELKQKLSRLVAELPAHQADVFVLSQIEGISSEEIAKILDCSVSTVRVHLHRAIKRLADKLSDYLPQRQVKDGKSRNNTTITG